MSKLSGVNATSAAPIPRKGLHPIVMIGMLFFIFGFITWLNSVLIPYLRIACELNNFESYLVAFAFYIAYFVMAIPSAMILKRTGFKKGMSLGLFVIALGALLFIPAAMSRTYLLFLLGLFVQGTGLALLQTASNPYVTILGPIESAAKRISIMGICNKVAGAIAPLVLGAITLKDADKLTASIKGMTAESRAAALDELATRVIIPYGIIVGVLIVLAIAVYFSSLPDVHEENETGKSPAVGAAHKISIFQFPHLLAGVLAIFLYVGAEVIAGDTIISYGASQGIALTTAKYFTTYTLIGMIVGYIIGIIGIPRFFTQQQALRVSALLGIVFTLIAVFSEGYVSVFSIALLGLANSLMWPAIWPLAIADLGKFTRIGSSLLIMGIAGGALLPLLYGKLADVVDPQRAYWVLVPCYVYIGYFAVGGYKLRRG